jgi:hypothetical protein
MIICIHTSGRPDKQVTLMSLPPVVREKVLLVVQEKETERYARRWPQQKMMVLPPEINRLSPTRQWILENAEDKVVMMDDDLTFSCRRPELGNPTKLYKAEPVDIVAMFQWIEDQLDEYAHVGISAREGNNRILEESKTVGRMMRLLAYDVEVFHREGVRFDRVDTKQDFDVTLQLLRKGLPNNVSYVWAHNQGGSNVAGGCSVYRTEEVMVRCANELATLHPDFVKVVEKETKTSWGGGVRTDVSIKWKKAYDSANN